ncbi:MAG: hypothetical protein AB9903_09635 [Vulcanimicrobiota bacterium]
MPSDQRCLRYDNLYIVPVCHYRMEYAESVRKAFLEVQPAAVAVELPSTLSEQISTAVGRFPFLSVIFYQNDREDMIYFPIEPTDPLCEAVRSGLEADIPVHFIDLDLDEYPLIYEPMPDSYAVYRIGLKAYWEEYRKAQTHTKSNQPLKEDELREMTMAFHLRQLLKEGDRVLLVCGMAHVEGIVEKLGKPQAQPLGKVVRKNIRIFNLHPDSIREVTGEAPFLISVYETARGCHRPAEKKEEEHSPKVISLSDRRKEKSIAGWNGPPVRETKEKLLEAAIFETAETVIPTKRYVVRPITAKGTVQELMKALAKRLNLMPERLMETVPDTNSMEVSRFFNPSTLRKLEAKRENVFRFKTSEDRRDELLAFYLDLAGHSEAEISGSCTAEPCRDAAATDSRISDESAGDRISTETEGRYLQFDRQALFFAMVKRAADYYRENTGEEIRRWQMKTFFKFSRNYALITNMLIADFYQLIMAARGVADDNFAYEVWDLGSYYPWLDTGGSFETIYIRADEVWLGGKHFTLRRKYPRLRESLMRIPVKERMKEGASEDWTKEFDDAYLCSYPPEDIIIEGYGAFLKKKAIAILSEERARVEPFTNSLLDGIDVKETIRNWHQEKKIYVRENINIGGGAGSVVVIFDEDRNDDRYPWKMTWLGEHHQESDMAFYATPMTGKIVGPGISRCEYGGFMLTAPPLRLYDVWTDPFYAQARSKSEVILMAAVEYSVERHVVYVAAKPPRSWFRTFAARLNKKIVYIPIGALSPSSLKKLRVFHVLSGRQVRDFAREYIW